MEDHFQIIPKPPTTTIDSLLKTTISASITVDQCLLNGKTQTLLPNNGESSLFQTSKIYLQIRGNYLLLINMTQSSIQCVFEANIRHSFEVIKNRKNDFRSQEIRQGSEIKFYLHFGKTIILSVYSADKQNISSFIAKLEKLGCLRVFEKNRYRPVQLKDKGSSAHVNSAVDTETGKIVAIRCFRKHKVIRKDKFSKHFVSQVKILKEITHKSFCQVQSVCSSDRSIYIVMEYLPNNLSSFLIQKGFPNYPTCQILLFKLAQSLQKLHSQNIMHRDIKMQNIMLRNDDITDPVIIDFGLARKGIEDPNQPYCGTVGYIAPEVLQQRSYDNKCDIFSLGIVFHYLLLGQMIFKGNTHDQILSNNLLCNIDLEFTKHPIPSKMRSLLAGMLARKPQDRLSAAEIVSHPFFEGIKTSSV